MFAPMNSLGDKEPPKEWWFCNVRRIAAFRLRNEKYLSANVTPLREQIHDTVEFISVAWEEIERHLNEEDKHPDKVQPSNRLSDVWACPHCSAEIDTRASNCHRLTRLS